MATQQVKIGNSTFNIDPSQHAVNPGSVFQSYDKKTGQTTYNTPPSGMYGKTGTPVATPQNLPSGQGSPQVANAKGDFVPLSKETAYVDDGKGGAIPNNGQDFNMPSVEPIKTDQQNQNKTEPAAPLDVQSLIDRAKAENADGIADLLLSGRVFSEQDAKNFAYFNKEKNWQQYVGSMGGRSNELYIGSNSWKSLQSRYTPYQLQQATFRTNNGIYWKEGLNINDIPRVDPADELNEDTQIISDLITDAKGEADVTVSDKVKDKDKTDLDGDIEDNNTDVMNLLNNLYSENAEDVYKELFKTPEIKSAQDDLLKAQREVDEYDQQLEELKNDIRKEVEGEASESYISAKAAVRGEDILKLRRVAKRNYDDALGQLSFLKEEAQNMLNVRLKDSDNRYNRLFNMLQLQIQQEGTQFNQNMALMNAAMQIPKGRSITVGNVTVKGLNEDANLNVVQFTETDGSTYVIGIDKNTGEQKYKQFIGKSRVPGGSSTSAVTQLNEYEAGRKLDQYKNLDEALGKEVTEQGAIRTSIDDDGNTFYYDAFTLEQEKANKGWWQREARFKPEDYILYYAK